MELGNIAVKWSNCGGLYFRQNCPNTGQYEKKRKLNSKKGKQAKFSNWYCLAQLETSFAELSCLVHEGLGQTKLQLNGAGCSSVEQLRNWWLQLDSKDLSENTKTKKEKNKLQVVWKSWDKSLGLNLLVPNCLLVCSWKLKVVSSAKGCVMLLLLLFLHCNCSAYAQLTPKHAQPLPNKCTILWWRKPRIVLF